MWRGLLLSLLVTTTVQAQQASAFLVQDLNGEVLLAQNENEIRPIASITKLVIASNASRLDQDTLIEIQRDDIRAGHMRSTPLRVGQAYTRRELIELALVSSDNVAAIALGRTLPEIISPFVTVVEASGLDPANQASAKQLARLASTLYGTEVAGVSVRPITEIGKRRSTNPLLLRPGWTFYLSKTGFISASGGCLVVITEMAKRVVTVVVLGSRNTRDRWRVLADLRHRLGDTNFAEPARHAARRVVYNDRRKQHEAAKYLSRSKGPRPANAVPAQLSDHGPRLGAVPPELSHSPGHAETEGRVPDEGSSR